MHRDLRLACGRDGQHPILPVPQCLVSDLGRLECLRPHQQACARASARNLAGRQLRSASDVVAFIGGARAMIVLAACEMRWQIGRRRECGLCGGARRPEPRGPRGSRKPWKTPLLQGPGRPTPHSKPRASVGGANRAPAPAAQPRVQIAANQGGAGTFPSPPRKPRPGPATNTKSTTVQAGADTPD